MAIHFERAGIRDPAGPGPEAMAANRLDALILSRRKACIG